METMVVMPHSNLRLLLWLITFLGLTLYGIIGALLWRSDCSRFEFVVGISILGISTVLGLRGVWGAVYENAVRL